MIQIVIIAKGTYVLYKAAFSELNKSKQQKNVHFESISKRNKSFVYHIEVKISDETYFVEKT